MKKSTFVNLLLGVLGGLCFGIGMCMCLLPEWNAFVPGVMVTAAGALLLIVLGIVSWTRAGKPMPHMSGKTLGKILLAVAGCLTLGTGMCMIMVWNMMLFGIIVGVIGIVMLLCLIPLFVELK